jgi:hypothetical protein
MDLGSGLGHLTYSTLVHPGDTWAEMRHSLEHFVPQVKARVSPDAPFGVSLRLSASSTATLTGDPSELAWLRDFLVANDLYVFTVNAFPYGPFKGAPVMERVYEPDWSTDQRVEYTNQVADILAVVGSTRTPPSIQTAPLAFAPNVTGAAYIEGFTDNLFRVVSHLRELEQRTGRRVTLALEPEPACFLETTDETVAYFTEQVYSPAGVARYARIASVPLSEAVSDVRRYLGVVFDIGHQSVGFEDIPVSLHKLVDAGIPIFKLQPASALAIADLTEDLADELDAFTDTIYLSQTSERRNGEITKYLHLADALAAYRADPGPRQLRTHFHLPVFLGEVGNIGTTREGVEQALDLHRELPLSAHVEIETYTWDVLPEHLKTGDIVDYVCRELEFVRGRLNTTEVATNV